MPRLTIFATIVLATLLPACAGPAPDPEPGMEVIHHAWGEEVQVAKDVDWASYTKVILHTAPVEFRKNWKSDQERLLGKPIRNGDVERIRKVVAGQFDKAMYTKLAEHDGFDLTDESGPGVMRFLPDIVDLDIQAVGWVQNSIVESYPRSRGSMTVELLISDSVSDELLAVISRKQTDPLEGEMDLTTNFSNTKAFRLMSEDWADWLIRQLEKAGAGR